MRIWMMGFKCFYAMGLTAGTLLLLFSLGHKTAPAFFFGSSLFYGVTFSTSEAQDDTHQRLERLSLCFDFSLSVVGSTTLGNSDWFDWALGSFCKTTFFPHCSQSCPALQRSFSRHVRHLCRIWCHGKRNLGT